MIMTKKEIETPSLLEQAKSLTFALSDWAKSGFVKVPSKIFEHRLSICKACDYWNPDGFSGLGQCKMCGCAVGKLHLPNSRCPLKEPKWTAVPAN
jgi:hypothetical protein